jgi:hypothetical protein
MKHSLQPISTLDSSIGTTQSIGNGNFSLNSLSALPLQISSSFLQRDELLSQAFVGYSLPKMQTAGPGQRSRMTDVRRRLVDGLNHDLSEQDGLQILLLSLNGYHS